MSLYFFSAKYSNAAFKGMVDTPQDREAAANKLFNAMGVKMHNIYFSVSSAEIVGILEGNAENMAALEMVTMSTGTFTSIDAKEVIDSKSMTAAMGTRSGQRHLRARCCLACLVRRFLLESRRHLMVATRLRQTKITTPPRKLVDRTRRGHVL